MNQKPDDCIGCHFYNKGLGFIKPEGKGTRRLRFVGEAGGHKEALEGLPFRPTAESGSKLEEAFRILSADIGEPITREQFFLYNVIQCQPPNNQLSDTPHEFEVIQHCKTHFNRFMENTDADVTVALGNTPLVQLTGVTGDAEGKQSISHLRGYVFQTAYGLVVPTYHPSYIRRGGSAYMPAFLDDIKKAINITRGTYTNYKGGRDYKERKYQTKPSLDDAKSFYYRVRDNQKLILTYDIETPEIGDTEEDEKEATGPVEIYQIQFSLGMGEGIAFPWEGEYIVLAQKILGLSNIKANHNTWLFDNPILKAKGINIAGRVHDTMWMFKHYHPSLERGLQKAVALFKFPFPWKHLYGPNLPYYGCADVDAAQYLVHCLPPLMKEKKVWEGYLRYVYDINIVMTKMAARGVPVDEGRRLALEKDLSTKQDEVDKEMQEIYPKELKGITPRRERDWGYDYGYVSLPKKVKEQIATLMAEGKEKGLAGRELGKYIKDNTAYMRVWPDGSEEWIEGLEVKKFETPDGEVTRWCREKIFRPSNQQVVAYLEYKQRTARTMKEKALYKVPLTLKPNPKTGVRHKTTGKDDLIPIWEATDDRLIELILKYRGLNKMLTNDIPNWKPGSDGRVHAEIGYTAPTGQKNARKPNIFNASKHATPEMEMLWGDETPPTKRFRDIIVAPSGYCLLEFDKRSFHVGMMGFLAEDLDYFRFSQIDPHSIFTSWIVEGVEPISLKWADEDIKLAAKEIKKRFKQVRQQQGKPTVLGNQLGLGPYKLQRQNRKFIKTIRRAEELQERIKHNFLKVENCKERLIEDAHFRGWEGITNFFGRIQYFYEVYSWKWNDRFGKWERKHGNDQEKVLAFHVQSNAFGMIDDEELGFGRLGIDEEFGFINAIHDSTVFLTEIGKRDKAIEAVYNVMSQKNQRLKNKAFPDGLAIGIDVSVGKNGGSMKEMEEIKFP